MDAAPIQHQGQALHAAGDAPSAPRRSPGLERTQPETLRRQLIDALTAETPTGQPVRRVDVQFQVERDIDRVVARIVDSETGEVVREVPPEDLVELARRVTALVGAMFDQRV